MRRSPSSPLPSRASHRSAASFRRRDQKAPCRVQQRRRLSPYLFTDEHGQLIHPDTFTKRLRKIYDAIGFPREYHLHTLRHYFVTSLLHCGVDKQTVADLVGHADTGFLERTYCHPQQAQKEQAADSMLTMLRPDGGQIFNLAAVFSEAAQRMIVVIIELNRFSNSQQDSGFHFLKA